MIVSRETLRKETGGYRPEILEKVLYLLRLLESLNGHPYLKNKLVLKGGTALNLFEFDYSIYRDSPSISTSTISAPQTSKL